MHRAAKPEISDHSQLSFLDRVEACDKISARLRDHRIFQPPRTTVYHIAAHRFAEADKAIEI